MGVGIHGLGWSVSFGGLGAEGYLSVVNRTVLLWAP